ncbi:MAG: hypothetical protein QF464_13115, partial [Myxococcota bacterium]|nr:hypothetical protein [Myxococcota bacterium]
MTRLTSTMWALWVLVAVSSAWAKDTTVTVEHITPSGDMRTVADVEVAVETWKSVPGPGADRQLDAVRHGRTDEGGVVRFAD